MRSVRGNSLRVRIRPPKMPGCHGVGKVRKLAEIVAATVLCGEISLGSAIVSEE